MEGKKFRKAFLQDEGAERKAKRDSVSRMDLRVCRKLSTWNGYFHGHAVERSFVKKQRVRYSRV
jgi:hypothetical protein